MSCLGRSRPVGTFMSCRDVHVLSGRSCLVWTCLHIPLGVFMSCWDVPVPLGVFMSCWDVPRPARCVHVLLGRSASCWVCSCPAGTFRVLLGVFMSCWDVPRPAGCVHVLLGRSASREVCRREAVQKTGRSLVCFLLSSPVLKSSAFVSECLHSPARRELFIV